MKIVILGAGQVGANLAATLADESNDVTLVDTNAARLLELQNKYDIRTFRGLASLPKTLREAGVDAADMLIAVTNQDETNMVACQIAWTLFHTPNKIARIRNSDFQKHAEQLFYDTRKLVNSELPGITGLPIDVLISPELLVTQYVQRLVDNPGSLQVLEFADGKVQMIAVRAKPGSILVGQQLRYLRQVIPNQDARVVAIFRKHRSIIPHGDTEIEIDDEVFFLADRANMRTIMNELRRLEAPYRKLMIAGGGNIGYRLAKLMQYRYHVKLVEHNEERAQWLGDHLPNTLVLKGHASDQDLLINENIEDIDVFIALTNDDEANIMSSLLAKRLGAHKVMCLINNSAYVDLVQGGDIDVAISPSQATIGSLLTHIRRGDVVSVHSLRRGAAEAMEAIAHGDPRSSKVVGRAIGSIDLPSGTTIGAVVRGDQVLVGHDDLVIETNDHVILFVANKKHLRDVERLFQVGFTFF